MAEQPTPLKSCWEIVMTDAPSKPVTTNLSLGKPANQEMIEGYMDGLDPNSPQPSDNRSRSYRHGFANGRDDRARKPRACHQILELQANQAMEADDNDRI